ncbi:MAG: CSLREA domain-containing protein [Rubrobacteraceae bacterium]
MTRRTFVGLAAALLAVGLMFVASPVHATTTFTVNSTGDEPDLNSTDGVCTISASRNVCTLRAAIEQANATAGADTIAFDIPDDPGVPGNEVRTIRPAPALPAITEPVAINGYSQSGASPNTRTVGDNAVLKVELNGANAGTGKSGFTISGGTGSAVRGMVITGFAENGILLNNGAKSTAIEGNFIGTDAAGAVARRNNTGVTIGNAGSISDNTIGGTSPAARNLISGNDFGVEIFGAGANNNKVQGNYIGTKANGTDKLGNGGDALRIEDGASGNVVGGTVTGARNVISGNGSPSGGSGVIVAGGSERNTVEGNYIGAGADGSGDLGNKSHGVVIEGASFNAVGRNVIAFNDRDGVRVTDNGGTGAGNQIRSNSIFGNSGLGVDLVPDGPTPNDPDDADTGPNGLQSFPVLTSVSSSGGSTNIQGTFNGFPNDTVIIQFFASPAADSSGFGEGKKYLGQTTVTTDGNGDTGFGVDVPSATAEQVLSATASTMGGTSEFSEAIIVNTAPRITNPHPKPGSKVKTRKPAISATVRDAQTNLAKSNIKLFVDGRARSFSYNAATDRLIRRSNKLSFGKHTVRIVATDAQGLKATRNWSFKVVRR